MRATFYSLFSSSALFAPSLSRPVSSSLPQRHAAIHSLTALFPAPTSFCKCTCGSNSTIIPLDAPPSRPSHPALFLRKDENDSSSEDKSGNDGDSGSKGQEKGEGSKDEGPGDRKEYRASNCNDCNRQFCLSYNLPICKNVGMEEVFTTCFRGFTPSHMSRLPQPAGFASRC